MNQPASKQDVYNPYDDPQWAGKQMVAFYDITNEAREQGFNFARAMTLPVDHNVWDINTSNSVGDYRDLPDTPGAENTESTAPETGGKSLLETVLDYLAAPERSERGIVIQKLNDVGFFTADNDDARRQAVNTVLAAYAQDCPSGAERARQALGNHLTPNTKTVRITIDVVVDDPTDSIGHGPSDYSVTYDFVNIVNSALNGRLGNWTLAKPIAYTEYTAQPDKEGA